jgi:hypothetical protein
LGGPTCIHAMRHGGYRKTWNFRLRQVGKSAVAMISVFYEVPTPKQKRVSLLIIPFSFRVKELRDLIPGFFRSRIALFCQRQHPYAGSRPNRPRCTPLTACNTSLSRHLLVNPVFWPHAFAV